MNYDGKRWRIRMSQKLKRSIMNLMEPRLHNYKLYYSRIDDDFVLTDEVLPGHSVEVIRIDSKDFIKDEFLGMLKFDEDQVRAFIDEIALLHRKRVSPINEYRKIKVL